MAKAQMSISLRADLVAGEGAITGPNLEKLESLLDDHGALMAIDVIQDWMHVLEFELLRAQWRFSGSMHRVGVEANGEAEPDYDTFIAEVSKDVDPANVPPEDALEFACQFEIGYGKHLGLEKRLRREWPAESVCPSEPRPRTDH